MTKPTAFALDFDGVLCDSAGETCAAAWRAGRALWPGWEAPEPPPAFLARFRELRPLLETGWQAIVLLRLVEEEFAGQGGTDIPVCAGTTCRAGRPARAGGTPAVTPAALADAAERVLAAAGLGVPELVRLFGEARDRWIAADPEGWLARHSFYPGVPEALNAAAARGCPLFILTTKQERFTERLLLGARPECRGLRTVFVEDRVEALERAAEAPGLAGVELRLATWGYCGDAGAAAAGSRILRWTLPEFTAALRG